MTSGGKRVAFAAVAIAALGASTYYLPKLWAPREKSSCFLLEECRTKCDANDAYACARTGAILVAGVETARDAPKAKTLFARACDAGDSSGCFQLARLLESGAAGVPKNAADASAAMKRAYEAHVRECGARYAVSCFDLAADVEFGRGTDKDDARAKELYAKAAAALDRGCKAKNAHDCATLANMIGEEDAARALSLFEAACTLGDPSACAVGGYSAKERGQDDLATRLFARACDAGDPLGCFQLTRMRYNAIAADRFLALTRARCDAGGADACSALADEYRDGEHGLPKDEKAAVSFEAKAAAIREKACEAGDATECATLGLALKTGIGAPRDAMRAATLLKRGCDLGSGKACAEHRPPVTNVVAIAGDGVHQCVAKKDGGVFCRGVNSNGELGDGTTEKRAGWVRVKDVDEASAIAVGFGFACAASRGAVWCWGDGEDGKLGAARPKGSPPSRVDRVADAVEIAAGDAHACARAKDGAIVCWGQALFGATGSSAAEPTVVKGIPAMRRLVAGPRATCAVAEKDGAVWCWGDFGEGASSFDKPSHLDALPAAVDVAIAGALVCARKADGTVACLDLAKKAPAANVADVVDVEEIAGAKTACARKKDGSVWCWGNDRAAARVDGLPPASALAMGDAAICVRTNDAMLWCWGRVLGDRDDRPQVITE